MPAPTPIPAAVTDRMSAGLALIVVLGLWHAFNIAMSACTALTVMLLSPDSRGASSLLATGLPAVVAGLLTGWLASRFLAVARRDLWVAVFAVLLGFSYFRWLQFIATPEPPELLVRGVVAVWIVVALGLGYILGRRRAHAVA